MTEPQLLPWWADEEEEVTGVTDVRDARAAMHAASERARELVLKLDGESDS